MSGKVLVSQSGLQSGYGGGTLHPALEGERAKEEKLRNRDHTTRSQNPNQTIRPQNPNHTTNADDFGPFELFAPLMLLYPLLVLGATVVGIVLRPSVIRTILIGAPTCLALLLLLLQAAIGFPLERRMNKAMIKAVEKSSAERNEFAQGGAMIAALAFDVHYIACFWMGLLSNLAALIALALEWYAIRSTYGSCLPDWMRPLTARPSPDG